MLRKSRKIPSKKCEWYGVYRKFVVLGSICRSLEAVVSSRFEADEWLRNTLTKNTWQTYDEYMIEPVTLIMQAWQPF